MIQEAPNQGPETHDDQEDRDVVLRVERNEKFKTISAVPFEDDPRLSWKAAGILAYLLTRPDGWEFHRSDITNRAPDGRRSVKSGLRELERLGYLHRERIRGPDGTFTDQRWVVSEIPDPDWAENSEKAQKVHNVGTSTTSTFSTRGSSTRGRSTPNIEQGNKEQESMEQLEKPESLPACDEAEPAASSRSEQPVEESEDEDRRADGSSENPENEGTVGGASPPAASDGSSTDSGDLETGNSGSTSTADSAASESDDRSAPGGFDRSVIVAETDDGTPIRALDHGPCTRVYLQVGSRDPKRLPLSYGFTSPADVAPEFARRFATLPRTLGRHPDTGHPVKAHITNGAECVIHEGDPDQYVDLPPDAPSVFDIGLDEAVDVLAAEETKPWRPGDEEDDGDSIDLGRARRLVERKEWEKLRDGSDGISPDMFKPVA